MMLRKLFLRYALLLTLGCFGITETLAQGDSNPFDIGGHRAQSAVNDSSQDPSKIILPPTTSSDNPFDIVAPLQANNNPTIQQQSKPVVIPQVNVINQPKPQSFLFALVLGILFLLTLLVSLSRSLIQKIYQAFFSDIVLRSLQRERSSLNTTIYISLYVMFMINVGVFIYLTMRHYGVLFYGSDSITLLFCILSILGIIIGKHLILGLLSFVFPISKELGVYNFVILIFGIITGLILAPCNVFLAYSEMPTSEYIIKTVSIIFLIIYTLIAIRSLFIVRNYIFQHFFHFLLYLCAVEIIPILIIQKLLISKQQIAIF
jgi:hypothetical protein